MEVIAPFASHTGAWLSLQNFDHVKLWNPPERPWLKGF